MNTLAPSPYWGSPFHAWWLGALLPVVLGIVGLVWWSYRRQGQLEERFASRRMLSVLVPAAAAPLATKTLLIAAGVGLLMVAAARPRFGTYYADVTSRSLDLFVLLDVSRSMLADDVKPSRLERAKSDVKDLLDRLSGDRVGLIAFAGSPVVQVPLTTDHAYFTLVLDELGSDSAPRGGSLIGDAVRKALESLRPAADRDQVLLLITDGEDQDSLPEEAARQAAERGIRIFAVGLGDSEEGSRIPQRDEQGNLKFVQGKDGVEHWSTLNERLLRSMALATKGAYIPAGTKAYDLGEIYDQHLADLTRGERTTEKRERFRERYQWFLAAGLLCLLIEMLMPATRPQPALASAEEVSA